MTERGFLSEWFERVLLDRIVAVIENYLNRRLELEKRWRVAGLVTRQKLMDDLDIKDDTLKRWETLGLKRYQPPMEKTNKIFYKETDVEQFLSVWRNRRIR